MISAADADLRQIQQGDTVRAFNDRGGFDAKAQITEDVSLGIVVATLGYWRQRNNATVNCVSSAEFVDMGHG